MDVQIESFSKDLIFDWERVAITPILESDFSKEIRIAMKKGQKMKEHKTAFPIVIQIIDGAIDFGAKELVHSLKKNDIISLKGNIPHDLTAKEDSVIRLTLSKSDSEKRVRGLVE